MEPPRPELSRPCPLPLTGHLGCERPDNVCTGHGRSARRQNQYGLGRTVGKLILIRTEIGRHLRKMGDLSVYWDGRTVKWETQYGLRRTNGKWKIQYGLQQMDRKMGDPVRIATDGQGNGRSSTD